MDVTIKETTNIESYLLDLLDSHSAEQNPDMPSNHTEQSFSFGLYDGKELIGGLTAKEVLGEFYISLLAISENYRKRGLGTCLMETAEQKARELHCHHMLLTTYSYQGVYFYPKIGFIELGRISNHPVQSVDKVYFIKYL